MHITIKIEIMNPKVEEFINKMKEEQEKQKKEYLISLGLVDESKSINTIEILDKWDGTNDCEWDFKLQKYCKKVQKYEALDVTDEEYQEILKYAPIAETQRSNELKPNKKPASQTRWSNVICTTAIILAVVAVIIGIISISFADSFMPIIWIAIYLIIYIPAVIGFARIVEAAEKYLQK